MQPFTLADLTRLPSSNVAGTRTHQVARKTNGSGLIDGVLNKGGLTVSLRSPTSRETLLERTCTRVDEPELRIIGDIQGHAYGFCEVFAGETREGLKVVIESHRRYSADPQGNASALKRFHRQALICVDLSHRNIAPFLGVFSSDKVPYACVFKSVGKSSLPEYLVGNPGAARLKLLVEVARGLYHIHDLGIVHGSIRGTNIRVDDHGTARIAGFASATLPNIISEDVDEFVESRWCSPELLDPDGFGLTRAKGTRASDMYAFGMLAYEIFSGRMPFHDLQGAAVVIAVVTRNERPPRPPHRELSGQLWAMIERSWQTDPSQRPTIQEFVTLLEDKDRDVRLQLYNHRA
ncbi:kinase-like domain-containing protein [Thelephora terrestris]|uniref:Kinase-like domain-containing protein n=1 Tax=Thelephora terrestris TaxID=56493 RepID=A0A9P6L6J6_9AGAM|nr:kinase-like domain-containing protein [Thelephora terrestris]